jgi:hypothetical protein
MELKTLVFLALLFIPIPSQAIYIELTNTQEAKVSGTLYWYAEGITEPINSYCSITDPKQLTLTRDTKKTVECILTSTNIPNAKSPLTIYAKIITQDNKYIESDHFVVKKLMCDSDPRLCLGSEFCYLSESEFPQKTSGEIIEAINLIKGFSEGLPEVKIEPAEKGCLPNNEKLKSSLKDYFGASLKKMSVDDQISLEIVNGLDKYSEKSKEQVFRRDLDNPSFKVTLNEADALLYNDIYVEVYKGDEWLSFVGLRKLEDGSYVGEWDYHTNSIEYLSNVPVGKYTAHAVIEKSPEDRMTSKDANFYVIFSTEGWLSDSELNAFLYDSNGGDRDEHGVWFTSDEIKEGDWWYGRDFGNIYYLHTFEPEVFLKAIDVIDGETSESDAALKLLNYEAGIFGYTTGNQPVIGCDSEDVLDMLNNPLPKVQVLGRDILKVAQCKDDASVLVSFLRSVGIPAHTVTIDANADKAKWNFDTWVEAWFENYWWVLHSHWPDGDPSIGPSSKEFVNGKGYMFSKDYNDLIITANEYWDEENLGTPQVRFAYFQEGDSQGGMVPADMPSDGRPYPTCGDKDRWIMSGWITELSQDYWKVTHDDPPGPLQEKNLTLSIDKSSYYPGDSVLINVTLKNMENISRDSFLNVSLLINKPKAKYKENFGSLSLSQIALKPGETRYLVIDFKIPSNFSSENVYFLEAMYGQDRDALTFEVEPNFSVDLNTSERIIENSSFLIKAKIINSWEMALKNITLCLSLSHNLNLTGQDCRTILEIPVNSSLDAEWSIDALEGGIGTATLKVFSESGGEDETTDYFRILRYSNIQISDLSLEQVDKINTPATACFNVTCVGDTFLRDASAEIIIPASSYSPEKKWILGDIGPGQTKRVCANISFKESGKFYLEGVTYYGEGTRKSRIFSIDVSDDTLKDKESDKDSFNVGLLILLSLSLIVIIYVLLRIFRR